MNAWDEFALAGEADQNMCHVPVDQCLVHLAPIFEVSPLNNILDLGCGIGRLLFPLSAMTPATIHGVDSSIGMFQESVHSWSALGSSDRVVLYHNDGETLPVTLPTLDAAFSIGMFQHVPNSIMQGYISQLANKVRPDGRFVFQFVYEGEEGPLSFNRGYDEVRQWLVKDWTVDGMEWKKDVKWCWVTATKR